MIASSLRPPKGLRVAVVGGGLIGLAIAWRLAQSRHEVKVFESVSPGAGASHAAAGMLSIVGEAHQGPGAEALFRLSLESRRRWPGFARELREASGCDLDLREEGTLLVAMNEAESAELEAIFAAYGSSQLVRMISASEAREMEPALRGRFMATAFAPEDGQVDNRAVVLALERAAAQAGVRIFRSTEVLRLAFDDGRATGVETASGLVAADVVIVAAGLGVSRLLAVSGLRAMPEIVPVKGELIALQMDPSAPVLRHVVRGFNGTYLVPRSSGRLIVGATSEPGNGGMALSEAARQSLHRNASSLVPALAQLEIVDHWCGLRPMAPDGLPLIGAMARGLYLAAGHYRNGVLLAPITADLIAKMLILDLSKAEQDLVQPFNPLRFASAVAG